MASDSSELTFVRCSSCRSLVPAVSTRCRMCGAPLDANGGDDATASQEDDQDSRVRQRTNSGQGGAALGGPGGMREARSGASTDVMGTSPAEPAPSSAPEGVPGMHVASSEPSVEEQAPVADPLGFQAASSSGQKDSAKTSSAGFEDPLSAYIQEVEVEESAKNGAQQEAQPAQAEPEPVPEPQPEPQSKYEPVSDPDAAPRMTVESGGRKGQGSSLSFGKQAAPEEPASQGFQPEAQPDPVEATPEKPKANPEPRAKKPQPKQEMRQEQAPEEAAPASRDADDEDAAPEARSGKKKRSRRRGKKSESPSEERADSPAPERSAQRSNKRKPVKATGGQSGRLFGWLVDYSDGIGSSIELREGKFFVSGSQLKPSDLVLDDPSVSTPHAMVQVGGDRGFVIQDLMSENGVYLRRRGQKDFVREEEAIDIENGDIIRFGDVEFVVSLIAEVGVK